MRNLRQFGFLIILFCFSPNGRADFEACSDLPACLIALQDAAKSHDGPGMGREGEAALRLLQFPKGVDALVRLLADPDPKIAELAAYGLREAPSIDTRHLPQIRAGLDRGLSWLPLALARIDSDEAAKEAVDRYLVSKSAPENQEGFAVAQSGDRAIPFIVELARCRTTCANDTHYLLAAALSRMGPERQLAAPALMSIVRDPKSPRLAVTGALEMIASLDTDGGAVENDLLHELDIAPQISQWIENALVGIKSSASGDIYARRLQAGADNSILNDIATTGKAAHDAGPALLDLLSRRQDPSSDLRPGIIRAIGFVGYKKGVPALVRALDDPIDARVAWTAAVSLGQLDARDAIVALDRTAEQHWYLPVRKAAAEAALKMRSGNGPARVEATDTLNNEYSFWSFENIDGDVPDCSVHQERVRRIPVGQSLGSHASARKLKQLTFDTEVLSYGASDAEEQRATGTNVVEVGPDNIVEHRTPTKQVPGVALRVEGGWVAGSNRGEWGGELMFLGDDGVRYKVLDENIEGIHRLGQRVVITTGLAHLSMNQGAVYDLTRDASGKWRASIWRVLPSAPAKSFLVEPTALFVRSIGGGAVVIESDGRMRMARCVTER